jgi:RNA polymerase sigma factor (sigma-70 family)
MISDEALMLDFQCGSHQAFEQLFARYRGPLYGFFRRRLNGDQRAEDPTQETFVAIIRASARYEPRALVRTYLYSIAMNLLAANGANNSATRRRKSSLRNRRLTTSLMPRSGFARLSKNWTTRSVRF